MVPGACWPVLAGVFLSPAVFRSTGVAGAAGRAAGIFGVPGTEPMLIVSTRPTRPGGQSWSWSAPGLPR